MPSTATCRRPWADRLTVLLLAACITSTASARPVKTGVKPVRAPLTIAEATFARDVCRLIENRARWRGIDPHFIARLINAESRFSPNAVSPAGAEGIAQFIPGTAKRRGLENPYDPAAALTASIDFLAHLKVRFGNLGLAAVAYNAGEGAASRFISGGGIPLETENYVASITGRAAEAWRKPDARHPIPKIGGGKSFSGACPELVRKPGRIRLAAKSAGRQPWGVLISESFSRSTAVRTFNRIRKKFPADLRTRTPMIIPVRNLSMGARRRYSARIGATSRKQAADICTSLRARSVICIVRRTR
ncbi:MAG: lytic transglycosylase domain-containing protein [Pseudomonadota bacterium]